MAQIAKTPFDSYFVSHIKHVLFFLWFLYILKHFISILSFLQKLLSKLFDLHFMKSLISLILILNVTHHFITFFELILKNVPDFPHFLLCIIEFIPFWFWFLFQLFVLTFPLLQILIQSLDQIIFILFIQILFISPFLILILHHL